MPYELMQRISRGPLPMTLTTAADVQTLHTLADGGWVKVKFAIVDRRESATVTELTAVGRFAMRFLQPPREH